MRSMGMTQAKMVGFGKGMQKVGRSLTRYITLPVIALGAYGLKAAADFEQSMANVQSVCQATAPEMKKLETAAIEMAKKYKGSAKDAADGLYYIVSAGYTATEAVGALEGVMSLATATQTDLAYTSEKVMAAISMFGLEAKDATKIADVYARACQLSQATMEKLGESMKYVGPIAKKMGWSLEDTTAALSMLYNKGIDASMAGTILRGALSRLIKPSGEAEKTLKKLKISQEELAKALKDPVKLLELFEKASLSARDSVTLFGQRAGPGMMTLLESGSKSVGKLKDELEDCAGTAEKSAKVQMETLKGKMEKLRDSFQAAAIAISKNEGVLDALSKTVGKVATWLGKLTPAQQKNLTKWLLIAAAIGPVLSLSGKLIVVIAGLTKAYRIVTVAASQSQVAMMGLKAAMVGLAAVGIYAASKIAEKGLEATVEIIRWKEAVGELTAKQAKFLEQRFLFEKYATWPEKLKQGLTGVMIPLDELRRRSGLLVDTQKKLVDVNKALDTALKNVKDTQERMNDAQYDARQAALDHEQAVLDTKEALDTYGEGSIQYRQALLTEERTLAQKQRTEKIAKDETKLHHQAQKEFKTTQARKQITALTKKALTLATVTVGARRKQKSLGGSFSTKGVLGSLGLLLNWLVKVRREGEAARKQVMGLGGAFGGGGGRGGGGGGGSAGGRQFGGWIQKTAPYTLHRGELVLPPNVASFFKRIGVPASAAVPAGGGNTYQTITIQGTYAPESALLLARKLAFQMRASGR